MRLRASRSIASRYRRRAITRSGVAIGVVGRGCAIALEIVGRYIVSHVYGAEGLTNAGVRAAVAGVWGRTSTI
jgi:hypothetical protein